MTDNDHRQDALINQIKVLDLVNGKTVTAMIREIIKIDGVSYLSCGKALMFIPMTDPNNPDNTQVQAFPYGYPLYDSGDSINIQVNHIVTIFDPSQGQKDSYAKHTGTIVTAPASALDQLDGIDFSKFQL
jgi:hypothetical protein